VTTNQPSRLRMLWRGATRRCPRCGAGKLFHHWFSMVPTCPRCGMKFEREEGYWTGAIAINTIIVGGLFTVVLVVSMILTVPDIPWVTVLMVVVPLMTIGPLILYPFSKTLWLAVDLGFLQPLGIKWDEGRSSA
jgi:uncharacterized protein (DUF983 family)